MTIQYKMQKQRVPFEGFKYVVFTDDTVFGQYDTKKEAYADTAQCGIAKGRITEIDQANFVPAW